MFSGIYESMREDPRPWAVAASLLLSLYTVLLPDSPNDDAYLYVRLAEMVADGGLATAYSYYAWASYSVLIAAFAGLGLEPFIAAYTVNALFFALLVYAFLSIAREISREPLFNLFAVLCILLYPELNELRYLIIRDVGFWALSLLALLMLIRFSSYDGRGGRDGRSGRGTHAASFALSLLAAAALRPEALVYLLLLPLTVVFVSVGSAGAVAGIRASNDTPSVARRAALLLKLYAAVLGLAAVVAASFLFFLAVDLLDVFRRFFAGYQDALQLVLNPDPAANAEAAAMLFGDYAADYSEEYLPLFIAAGLLPILVMNVLGAIGGPYCWLLLYGLVKRRLSLPRPVLSVAGGAALISLGILSLFLFATRFLSSRYAMLLALVTVLLLPGLLSGLVRDVWAQRSRWRQRTLGGFLALFFFYCAVDSFVSFGPSKVYVTEAARWINSNIGQHERLITNNSAIAYHSGRIADYDRLPRNLSEAQLQATAPGDLIAIEWRLETARLLERHFDPGQLQLLAEFSADDDEDDRVLIYRRLR